MGRGGPISGAGSPARRKGSDAALQFGFGAIALFFVGSGLLSYRNIQILGQDSAKVVQSHEVIMALDDLMSTMKDAETGQRGFLITGSERYLDPYNQARDRLNSRLDELTALIQGNSSEAFSPTQDESVHR